MWLLSSSGNYGGKIEWAKKEREPILYGFSLKCLRYSPFYHVPANSITLFSPSKGVRQDRKETQKQRNFHNKLWSIIIVLLDNSRALALSSAQCLKISVLVRIIVKNCLWLPFAGLGSENFPSCKYLYQGSLQKTLLMLVPVLGDFL